MTVYTISYDLSSPGHDYSILVEHIKGLGAWWHYLDSTWIVDTEMSAAEIRDRLSRYIDANDELLVAKLAGEAAWTGFDKKSSDWLKSNL
jgi:hypothetical protein